MTDVQTVAPVVATHKGEVVEDSLDIEFPMVFAEAPASEVWQKSPQIQVALGGFGGKYKKQPGFAEESRSQMHLKGHEGGAETITMFNSLKGSIPKTAVVTLEGLMARVADSMWLYGYSPKMRTISCTPNGLPMFKMLASGEVKWLLLEVGSLLAGLRSLWSTDTIGYQQMVDDLPALTLEDLRALKESGVVMRSCIQKQWEAIYVPAGWLLVEESCKGVLLYGARCSFCARHAKLYASYESLIGAYNTSGKSTVNMQKAFGFSCNARVSELRGLGTLSH